MTPACPVTQSGAFVDAAAGRRFRLVSTPQGQPPRGTVVFVHAFAEEMNKSRRMAARLARGLAANGWRVVQRDLAGCGDSSGEFGDASWADWLDDVRVEAADADRALPIWLCCHRAGALLAPAALAERPDAQLLLWQPVMSGAQHLQQFLRLHAGARIVGAAQADGAASPAKLLREGQRVEVGGYELSPALAQGLEQANFDLAEGFAGRIAWFELSGDESPALSPASLRHIERLRKRGIPIHAEALAGPAFWQMLEIEESDALIDRSLMQVCAPAHD